MPGDSPLLRASLVLLTYLVAVVVPNVQSLISLAGALAGSSTALLIPPALELAYLRHLERDGEDDGKTFILCTQRQVGAGTNQVLLSNLHGFHLLCHWDGSLPSRYH